MDTGGLAQMSYNNNHNTNFQTNNNVLGLPGSGFAARRAGGSNHVKRLSFEPKVSSGSGSIDHGLPTPRTSRSHLLAGLRTAPKSAYPSMPSTAPAAQQHFKMNGGMAASMYAQQAGMSGQRTGGLAQPNMYNQQHAYPMTEQILSPPDFRSDAQGQDQMDPNLYAQLVATNLYLAEQQQRLQQQLQNVKAAAHQMQMLGLDPNGQQFVTPPITPQNVHMFQQQQQMQQQMQQQQQQQQQMQPIITPVAGAPPGVYSYYNPLTRQQTYFVDNNAARVQQQQYQQDSIVMQTADYSPPPQPGTPRLQVSPPPNEDTFASISPPKKNSPPPMPMVTPLPPPSAGAFRRGHRKAESMAFDNKGALDSPRGSGLTPKTTGLLPSSNTPTTSAGFFGPGQARAGDHPIRQPRGPPPLDELMAKPTTKFEGSKNFATRTRRSAVGSLVRAGEERRRGSGSMSSVLENGGERENSLAISSEDDSDDSAGRAGSFSGGRPSAGSSRTSAHGAIGSDRPSRANSFERKTLAQESAAEGAKSMGSFAAMFKNNSKKADEAAMGEKRGMLVLSSSAAEKEKRKSSMF